MNLLKLAGPVIKLVGGVVKRKQDLNLQSEKNAAAWEKYSAKAMKNSWRAGFITLIMAGPVLLMELGVLAEAFLKDPTLTEASNEMAVNLDVLLNGNYSLVLLAVVSAAVSIRLTDKVQANKLMNKVRDVKNGVTGAPAKKTRRKRKITQRDWHNRK